MTLPLFDDQVSRAPRRVTLVRLSGEIARSLVGIGRLAVEGEVYRPTTSQGGWMFFTLRDRAAQISVKVPASTARRSRVVAGERVCVVGSLQWANERGQVQLGAEEITPVGEGAVARVIAETRARLVAEGLLDRPRKAIPLLAKVVGVVCGSDAAVRKDIESVAAVRCPGYPIHFEETTVSGPGASLSIVEAILRLVRRPGVEVVILARGGGDAPSLLPWSSEEVCRSVVDCPVPVVSAIGHEGDRPLCDEVADLRCGTPSLAATAVLPDLAGLRTRVDSALMRGATSAGALVAAAARRQTALDPARALSEGLVRASSRLDRAGVALAGRHPGYRLRAADARLSSLDWARHTWAALGRAEGRLAAEYRHLHALSPQRTLDRGYAVVTSRDGSVLRSTREVGPGDVVGVRLAQGRFDAVVTAVDPVPNGQAREMGEP
jgi:exodeoxyribonuclease VII large subunit